MADERLLQAVDALRLENAQYHDENYAKQGKQVESGERTAKLMGALLDEFRQGRGDAEEARRDAAKGKDQDDKKKGPGAPKIDDEFNLKGILQIVAGIGVAVAGFAAGLVSGFGRILSLATKRFQLGVKGLFAPVARFIDAITDVFGKRGTNQFLKGNTYKTLGNLTNTFRGFADGIKGLETRFARALNGIKSIGTTVRSYAGMITNSVKDIAKLKIGQAATAIKTGVQTIFSGLTNIQRAVTGGASSFRELRSFATLKKKIMQPLQAFGKAFTGVAQNVDRLGTAAKAFAKVGGTLGKIFGAFKVIGRFIAFPLTVIMGLVDGFKGMMAGAERQEGMFNKLVGGFIGAIGGVIKGLIMVPLDLLKSAVSWVAGKLGFENFASILDSFSFADTFTGFINRFTDGLIYTFTNLFNSIMKPFEDGFSFGALLEFVVTLPYKITFGLLDLVKSGVASLLGAFGATDMEATLGSFSFTEMFVDLIDFVKSIPTMFSEFITGAFAAEDPIAYLVEPILTLVQKIKDFVLGLIPSADDIADMAGGLVSGAADFLGFGGSDEEQEQKQPQSDMSEDEATKQIKDEESSGRYAGMNAYERKQARLDRREDQMRGEREVGVVETTGTDEDGTQFVERKRVETGESRYAGMNRFERRAARVARREEQLRAIGEREAQRAGNDRGAELDSMSRENAQKGGANNVTIAAPSQSNVTNNNSNTSAIIDQNLPTVDHNDRSWSYA